MELDGVAAAAESLKTQLGRAAAAAAAAESLKTQLDLQLHIYS